MVPYVKVVEEHFRRYLPERYFAQAFCGAFTHPDWLISEAFSTITINKNWRTRVHTDKGDFKAGFGVITCFLRGPMMGGQLIFPKFRIAVDFRERDILLADVHECHGNAPILGNPFDYERISCVFYLRERIVQCGSRKQELLRLQSRRVGDPLFGWNFKEGFIPANFRDDVRVDLDEGDEQAVKVEIDDDVEL